MFGAGLPEQNEFIPLRTGWYCHPYSVDPISPLYLQDYRGCDGLFLGTERSHMNNEPTFTNYQAYSRIVEMMSLMERLEELTPEDVGATVREICEIPNEVQEEISMEEVLFWAGLATGMEVCRNCEEGHLDEESAEKLMAYASLFAYSTQNAVVELTLQQLEEGHKMPKGRR